MKVNRLSLCHPFPINENRFPALLKRNFATNKSIFPKKKITPFMKIFIRTLSLLLFPLGLMAQSTERFNIPVTIDGETLDSPWAGGLDNPQFSVVDLNNDGNMDLYTFDRVGNVHVPFLNVDNNYVFAPQFIESFPDAKNFVLLRDFDGDGIADMFAHSKSTASVDGMSVWKGKYTGDKLTFDAYQFPFTPNIMPFPLSNGNLSNLYVASTDIPDINDIDGDGDLDVLAFDVAGAYLVYYQNQSVEEGYGLDSLIFEKEDECWGKFYESSMSETVSLSSDPNSCSTGLQDNSADERHAGSTTTSVDLDNDGDRELLIGDIINPYLFMLVNGGSPENAWMTGQDNSFPASNTTVFIPDFIASFVEDVDFDGIEDMIAAPNANNSPNQESAWFYKNTGTNAFPNYELQHKDFMTRDMIDFGSGTHPAFGDVNGDGLMDLVVGTYGYNLNAGLRDPRLFLFLNTGTANVPEFTLESDDWLNFSIYAEEAAATPTWAYAPNFGDMDSDGDMDLVVGEYYGTIFYGENTGGAGNPMQFDNIVVEWKNLDVGLNSTPQIVDLDRNGTPDIVIGERNGNTNFMKNIGTPTVPEFNEEENEAPNINFLGEVDAAAAGEGFGHSAPFFYDFNGEWTLYMGSRSQDILVYNNIDIDNLDAPFNLETAQLGDIHEGQRTHPALADLTGANELDMIIGNFRGGLAAFGTDLSTGIQDVDFTEDMMLFPNPVQSTLQVKFAENVTTRDYVIYNSVGQIMKQGTLNEGDNYLSVRYLSSGIYFLATEGSIGKFVKK